MNTLVVFFFFFTVDQKMRMALFINASQGCYRSLLDACIRLTTWAEKHCFFLGGPIFSVCVFMPLADCAPCVRSLTLVFSDATPMLMH